MDYEKWVSSDEALYQLRVRCNLSPGAAQNKLRAICVEGDVRIFDPLAPLIYYDAGMKLMRRGAEVQGTTLNLPIPERLQINFQDLLWWFDRNAPAEVRPVPVEQPLSSPAKGLTAEEDCKMLINKIKEGPRLTRAATHMKAKTKIRDLTDKEFDRAWKAAAPPAWKVGGRFKKLP